MQNSRIFAPALKPSIRHGIGLASVFLLVLVVAQGLGWMLAWQCMQWQAKTAAEALQLQQKTPVRSVILSQDFYRQAKVGAREIRLNGDLYDIHSRELKGDSIRLELHHDKAEQALLSILNTHFKEHTLLYLSVKKLAL